MKNATKKKSQPLKKRSRNAIIVKHISRIKRTVLVGEKRKAFLGFLQQSNQQNGLYALYDKRGQLYYIGKAIDLKKRLNNHINDKHRDNWDSMSLFFLSKRANVSELEGLLVAAADPPGNTQRPKIGTDLRKELNKFLDQEAKSQNRRAIFPDRVVKKSALSKHITSNRIKMLSKTSLSRALSISQSKLNKLWEEDATNLRAVRRFIRQSGKRDAVLTLIDKLKD